MGRRGKAAGILHADLRIAVAINIGVPQARLTPSERERIYICDFRRCRLNVRLSARIQPLLPDHKYRFFLFLRAVLWLLE